MVANCRNRCIRTPQKQLWNRTYDVPFYTWNLCVATNNAHFSNSHMHRFIRSYLNTIDFISHCTHSTINLPQTMPLLLPTVPLARQPYQTKHGDPKFQRSARLALSLPKQTPRFKCHTIRTACSSPLEPNTEQPTPSHQLRPTPIYPDPLHIQPTEPDNERSAADPSKPSPACASP